MSTAAPTSPAKKPADKKDQKLTPPDEQFWIRYSPHYEMPLSWVGSGAIHILVFGLVFLMAIAIPFLFKDNRPVEMDSVRLDASGGGGGNLKGAGDKSGNANGENIEEMKNQDDKKVDKKVDTPDLTNKNDVAFNLPSLKDPDIQRLIDSNNQAVKDIQDMNRITSDAIRKGLAPPKGEGGPGTGGGKGSGEGTGTGGDKGPGKEGALSVREQRMLRWTMSFDIHSGADYATQLRALGVIIAVDLPDEPGKARVYHRIEANAKGDVEELSSIKRMPWIDGRGESVGALCGYMGIRPTPPRLIAYMTEEMEAKLLKLELNYAGKDEDRIKETVFKIVPMGVGRYEPRVVKQR